MGRRIERLNIFLGPNELICIPEYNVIRSSIMGDKYVLTCPWGSDGPVIRPISIDHLAFKRLPFGMFSTLL